MSVRALFAAALFWLNTIAVAVAQSHPGKGHGNGQGKGHGNGHAAPEIDGPWGVAAVALLVCAGLIMYNRFRK